MTFIIGQRWISNTESQLGLGIIMELNGRHVSISFPAANEERIYAIDNAPLSRIIFAVGDLITNHDDEQFSVTDLEEKQGLVIYTAMDEQGNEHSITELSLNCFIKLSLPQQRLFSGLLDKLYSYKLRIDTLEHSSRLQQSPVKGLLGSRTNHLPHQIYIANEVARRYAPRVLLADEVGLGKTIEAGMILHYQLHTGRARRVLIVVPDHLIHQWLVEMIRRFNLNFSIFDQSHFERIYDVDFDDEEFAQQGNVDNLFDSEPLILCGLNFLMNNFEAQQQALSVDWDLLIVDEAHHLVWSPDAASEEYQFIEQLSSRSKGLLLLTATPEQVGIESHFARLRLLDPSRFYDLEQFKKEEANYQNINQLVKKLLEYQEAAQTDELNDSLKNALAPYLDTKYLTSINQSIKNLLDRHGTGRIFFRNTRAAIQGFPARIVNAYPLENTNLYCALGSEHNEILLYPEVALGTKDWLVHDPRVAWLANKLLELHPQKVLIICAKASTALALEQHLKLNMGIRSTAFHEGLSIIERDRAAAYFAEEEQGAQALICSEIGSEGRNFQFAHHLILFDLPLNPDLLEQRIGRLDRIGQRHSIEIHIPYLKNSAQEILFRWYHEGINLFEQSCAVGYSLLEFFEPRLLPLLCSPADHDAKELDQLIIDTRNRTAELNQALHNGRDQLLEMNSCNTELASELIQLIESEENNIELENYMAQVYQEFGVDHEFHSSSTEILRPTEHLKTHFPGLKEEGTTVTYSRTKALVREDMDFLSWEHPIVQESMEMILNSELGNVTVTTISIKNIAPGTLFLETFYTINCAAPRYLQLDQIVPLTPIRLFMDVSGKNLSTILSYEKLNELCEPVKRHLAFPVIKQIQPDIEKILNQSMQEAEQQKGVILDKAQEQLQESISAEIERLQSLQKVNPAIRDEEINYFKQLLDESAHYLHHATLIFQAVRVVINK